MWSYSWLVNSLDCSYWRDFTFHSTTLHGSTASPRYKIFKWLNHGGIPKVKERHGAMPGEHKDVTGRVVLAQSVSLATKYSSTKQAEHQVSAINANIHIRTSVAGIQGLE